MSEENRTNKILTNQEISTSKNNKPEIQDILNSDFLKSFEAPKKLPEKKTKISNLINFLKENNTYLQSLKDQKKLLFLYDIILTNLIENNNNFVISQIDLIEILSEQIINCENSEIKNEFINFYRKALPKLFDKFYLQNQKINQNLIKIFDNSIKRKILQLKDYYPFIENICIEEDDEYKSNILYFLNDQINHDENITIENIPVNIIEAIKKLEKSEDNENLNEISKKILENLNNRSQKEKEVNININNDNEDLFNIPSTPLSQQDSKLAFSSFIKKISKAVKQENLNKKMNININILENSENDDINKNAHIDTNNNEIKEDNLVNTIVTKNSFENNNVLTENLPENNNENIYENNQISNQINEEINENKNILENEDSNNINKNEIEINKEIEDENNKINENDINNNEQLIDNNNEEINYVVEKKESKKEEDLNENNIDSNEVMKPASKVKVHIKRPKSKTEKNELKKEENLKDTEEKSSDLDTNILTEELKEKKSDDIPLENDNIINKEERPENILQEIEIKKDDLEEPKEQKVEEVIKKEENTNKNKDKKEDNKKNKNEKDNPKKENDKKKGFKSRITRSRKLGVMAKPNNKEKETNKENKNKQKNEDNKKNKESKEEKSGKISVNKNKGKIKEKKTEEKKETKKEEKTEINKEKNKNEEKNEIKSEIKTDVKSENKTEIKSEAKPEIKNIDEIKKEEKENNIKNEEKNNSKEKESQTKNGPGNNKKEKKDKKETSSLKMIKEMKKNNKNKNDFTFEILVKAPDNSKVQVYNDETPIEDNTNNNINTINENEKKPKIEENIPKNPIDNFDEMPISTNNKYMNNDLLLDPEQLNGDGILPKKNSIEEFNKKIELALEQEKQEQLNKENSESNINNNAKKVEKDDPKFDQIKSLLGNEICESLANPKWEMKKHAFELINGFVNENESNFYSVNDLFEFIKIKLKNFKETNFNIIREAMNIFISMLKKRILSKDNLLQLLNTYYEKIADIKLKDNIIELINTSIEESVIDLTSLISNLITKILKKNNVKILIEFSQIFSKMVEDFDIRDIPVKELINYCKYMAGNSNPQVRTSATNLICMIYKYVGEDVKILIKDIKESTLKIIEAELEKVTVVEKKDQNKIKKNIKKKEKQEISEVNKRKSGTELELVGPVDISKKLNSQLLKDLSEGKWIEKREACENIEKMLTDANMKILPNGLNDLFSLIKTKLSDGNKNLVKILISLVTKFIQCLKKEFKPWTKMIALSLIPNLSDKNQAIRNECQLCFEKWVEHVGIDTLVMYFPQFLKNDNVEIRIEIMKFIKKYNDKFTKNVAENVYKELVDSLLICLQDRSNNVRNEAEEIIKLSLSYINIDLYFKKAKDFKPAIEKDLKQILDNILENRYLKEDYDYEYNDKNWNLYSLDLANSNTNHMNSLTNQLDSLKNPNIKEKMRNSLKMKKSGHLGNNTNSNLSNHSNNNMDDKMNNYNSDYMSGEEEPEILKKNTNKEKNLGINSSNAKKKKSVNKTAEKEKIKKSNSKVYDNEVLNNKGPLSSNSTVLRSNKKQNSIEKKQKIQRRNTLTKNNFKSSVFSSHNIKLPQNKSKRVELDKKYKFTIDTMTKDDINKLKEIAKLIFSDDFSNKILSTDFKKEVEAFKRMKSNLDERENINTYLDNLDIILKVIAMKLSNVQNPALVKNLFLFLDSLYNILNENDYKLSEIESNIIIWILIDKLALNNSQLKEHLLNLINQYMELFDINKSGLVVLNYTLNKNNKIKSNVLDMIIELYLNKKINIKSKAYIKVLSKFLLVNDNMVKSKCITIFREIQEIIKEELWNIKDIGEKERTILENNLFNNEENEDENMNENNQNENEINPYEQYDDENNYNEEENEDENMEDENREEEEGNEENNFNNDEGDYDEEDNNKNNFYSDNENRYNNEEDNKYEDNEYNNEMMSDNNDEEYEEDNEKMYLNNNDNNKQKHNNYYVKTDNKNEEKTKKDKNNQKTFYKNNDIISKIQKLQNANNLSGKDKNNTNIKKEKENIKHSDNFALPKKIVVKQKKSNNIKKVKNPTNQSKASNKNMNFNSNNINNNYINNNIINNYYNNNNNSMANNNDLSLSLYNDMNMNNAQNNNLSNSTISSEKELLEIMNNLFSEYESEKMSTIIIIHEILCSKYQQNKYILIPNIDSIIKIIIQITHELFDSLENLNNKIMPLKFAKYIVTILCKLTSNKELIIHISYKVLYDLCYELLNYLLINGLDKIGSNQEGSIIFKSLNSTMLRVMENCDSTSVILALLEIIKQNQNNINSNFLTNLATRCLFKATNNIESIINNIQLDKILLQMHLLTYNIDKLSTNNMEQSQRDIMVIKFIKNFIIDIVKIKKLDIMEDYNKSIKNHQYKDKYIINWIKTTLESIDISMPGELENNDSNEITRTGSNNRSTSTNIKKNRINNSDKKRENSGFNFDANKIGSTNLSKKNAIIVKKHANNSINNRYNINSHNVHSGVNNINVTKSSILGSTSLSNNNKLNIQKNNLKCSQIYKPNVKPKKKFKK